MQDIRTDYQTTISRACRIASLPRSQAYYQSRKDDTAVIRALQEHTSAHPTHGFALSFAYLKKEHPWNHKRVYRVYKALKLNIKRKGKRRLAARPKLPLTVPEVPNTTWSMDFMSDSLMDGRKFRTFNLIDDTTRRALVIEVGTSLPAQRVTRALQMAIALYGKPEQLRCDNGPEFISKHLELFCTKHEIKINHIQPGSPTQNAFIERFNKTFRTEILDAHAFLDLDEVRYLTEKWLIGYNTERPHQGLDGKTPQQAFEENFYSSALGGLAPLTPNCKAHTANPLNRH
jgi:putative transposase